MPGCSGERLYQCICSQVTYETSICSTSLLTRGIGSLLILAVLLRVWWQPLHVSSALSLTHSNTEHLLTFVWTLTYFVRCQFTSFCPFKNPSCLFKRKEFWTSLLSGYILRIFPSNLWEEIFSIYLWSAVSYYFLIKKCLFIWLHPDLAGACGIISLHRGKRDFQLQHADSSCSMWNRVPWPGIQPRPPAWAAWSLSHWTTREVPALSYSKECLSKTSSFRFDEVQLIKFFL